MAWIEQLTVDAATENPDVTKTQSLQAFAQIGSRDQGSPRATVKPSQVTSNDRL
jgi:hypothetical protein